MKSDDVNEVVVRYLAMRMLLTLELNKLIEVVESAFGDSVRIVFEPMTPEEQASATELVAGVTAVRERFHIFERDRGGALVRRVDLERVVVHEGRK